MIQKNQQVPNTEVYEMMFSEEGFWKKVMKYAKKAGQGLIEKAFLLYYLAQNPNTLIWD